MSCLPKLSKLYLYLLTFFLLLAAFLFARFTFAQTPIPIEEDKLKLYIDQQERGRLPGARLDDCTPCVDGSVTINGTFDMFEPLSLYEAQTVRRIVTRPGPLEVPACYFRGEDDAIVWTSDCDTTTTDITGFYLPDGTPIPAGAIDPINPDVDMGSHEGAPIRYQSSPGVWEEIYISPLGFEEWPYDGEPMEVTFLPDVNGNGIMDQADTALYNDTILDADAQTALGGATREPARYFKTAYIGDPVLGPFDVNGIPVGDILGCDYDYNRPETPPTYPEGYLYDYDGDAGPIEPIKPDGIMYNPVAAGQPYFDQACHPLGQCIPTDIPGGNFTAVMDGATPDTQPVLAGDVIYDLFDASGTWQCIPRREGRTDPVRNIRAGDESSEEPVPLFMQRFWDEYDTAQRNAYLALGTPGPPAVGSPVPFSIDSSSPFLVSLPPPYDSSRISMELAMEGDFACVYAYTDDPKIVWKVEREYLGPVPPASPGFPQTIEEVFDIYATVAPGSSDLGSAHGDDMAQSRDHCFKVTFPVIPHTPVNMNAIISPICTDPSIISTGDLGATPPIPAGLSNWPRPFTSAVVECIHQTLENIFIYDPAETERLTFFHRLQLRFQFFLRALLVLYVIVFGFRLIISKNPPGRAEIQTFLLRAAIIIFFTFSTGIAWLYPYATLVSRDLSTIVMQAGIDSTTGGGYSYCDFSGETYVPGHQYIMLWDTIDCKLSKILGIGDVRIDTDGNISTVEGRGWGPNVLYVGATAVVSTAMGLPIFIISIVVLIFLITIIVRAVHIYILAFMGLIMLLFISPLILPAALFDYTRDIFIKWLGHVMSYLIQPVILFGFLSFALVVVDVVYFGNNNNFVPLAVDGITGIEYQIESNTTAGVAATTLLECDDPDAIGCIYQTSYIRKADIPFISTVTDIRRYEVVLGDQELTLFIGLLKLLLICFITKALLATVEQLAAQLTGGDSAGGLGGAPVVGPAAAMAGQSAVINTGFKGFTYASHGLARAVERAGTARRVGVAGDALGDDILKKEAQGTRLDDGSLLGKANQKNMAKHEMVEDGPKILKDKGTFAEDSLKRGKEEEKMEGPKKLLRPAENQYEHSKQIKAFERKDYSPDEAGRLTETTIKNNKIKETELKEFKEAEKIKKHDKPQDNSEDGYNVSNERLAEKSEKERREQRGENAKELAKSNEKDKNEENKVMQELKAKDFSKVYKTKLDAERDERKRSMEAIEASKGDRKKLEAERIRNKLTKQKINKDFKDKS